MVGYVTETEITGRKSRYVGKGIDRFSIASFSRKVKVSHSPSEVK